MPYNTRRKSISLSALGVQVPGAGKDVSRSARSLPNTTTASEQPPTKRIKRSHTLGAVSISPPSPPRTSNSATHRDRLKRSGAGKTIAENTPPPSPGKFGSSSLDTEGINDDVVVAVLRQIEQTGNRPHHVKELAALLTNQLSVVESSANPQAIISSRLTTYLRRPWTALAPCPLGKELIGTHPKRTYFFLTTTPHQPIVEPPLFHANATKARVITPSLSSDSVAEDDETCSPTSRTRMALSPSPELDLSAPELDGDPSTSSLDHQPVVTFSHRSSLSHDSTHRGSHPPTPVNIAHNRRAQSPPLERDEKEFTATASSIQRRSKSLELERKGTMEETEHAEEESPAHPVTVEDVNQGYGEHGHAEDTISIDLDHEEDPTALFGHPDGLHLALAPMLNDFHSPIMRPLHSLHISPPLPAAPVEPLEEDAIQSLFVRKVDGLDGTDTMQDVRIALAPSDVDMGVDPVTAGFPTEPWNSWDELKSPELVGLSELDDLFDRY